METEPSVLIRPLIATLTQGVSRSRAETDVLQLSRQLCGVLDGAPGAAACVKMETEPSVLIRPLIATLTQGVSRSRAETDVLQLSRQLCGVLELTFGPAGDVSSVQMGVGVGQAPSQAAGSARGPIG